MQGAITHLIAGVPVSELGAAIDWYTRLFGRAPDLRAGVRRCPQRTGLFLPAGGPDVLLRARPGLAAGRPLTGRAW